MQPWAYFDADVGERAEKEEEMMGNWNGGSNRRSREGSSIQTSVKENNEEWEMDTIMEEKKTPASHQSMGALLFWATGSRLL